MKVAEWKFTFTTAKDQDWTEEQIEWALKQLEIIEERVTQYINDNLPKGVEVK